MVVDKLTKYAHFLALAHPYTAAIVVAVFINEIYILHGLPESIIFDRDIVFLSTFWTEFFTKQGTTLHKNSAYHQQSDGQTENINKTPEQYLRCVIGERPVSWLTSLPWAKHWYNSAHHSAIWMTPFKELYGYEALVIPGFQIGTTTNDAVDEPLQSRYELLSNLKRNLEVAQCRMKSFYDKRHTERSFVEGDYVYMKLQPYMHQYFKHSKNQKLASRYYKSFLVEKKIGQVAYQLKLPLSSKVHPVFHIFLLKKKLGDNVVIAAHLPPYVDPHNPRWYPARILDRGIFRQGNAPVFKWLIDWLGASPEDTTWKEVEDFKRRFPDFPVDG